MQRSDQSTIFNIFHDGTFLSFQKEADTIHFRIEIQYLAAMIHPNFTTFTGILKNYQKFVLQLWEDEKRFVDDVHSVSKYLTDTEISHSSFEEDQVFVYCVGEDRGNSGATLIFSCESITIFDEDYREIPFEELQELSQHYWKL